MNLQQTGELANKISEVPWVKWVHPRTAPATTSFEKKVNAVIASIIPTHCAKCLNMNGCCFAEDKCPESPLHENCHCKAERIDNVAVTAECPIGKFTGYIFNALHNNGKKYTFEKRGFSIADSARLKTELERQAYNSYISGNYVLDKLDNFGQRINIEITLICPNGETIKFISGWLVYPNGKIANATPCQGELL